MSSSATQSENNEKAVKLLVENHRLVLTLLGFLIAGLFAFSGRGSTVITAWYFFALLAFILSAVAIVIAVSVSISQATSGNYDPHDKWMTYPYYVAVISLITGLVFAAVCLNSARGSGQTLHPNLPQNLLIESDRVHVPPDCKLNVEIVYSKDGRLERAAIRP